MTTDTTTDLAELARQLAAVQTRLAPLKEQEAALKAQIREHLSTLGPGTYQAGDHTIAATATRRIDVTAIAEIYPVTSNPELYKLTVDVAAVRKHLAPAVVDALMTTAGDMGIRVDQ